LRDPRRLLYADGGGAHLREEVGLADLEERLRDSRLIVRESQPPAVLAVRLSDGLELALRRAGPPGPRMEAAANVVRRRLRTHLQHVLASYRNAAGGRREG